ncbi:MAG: vanadium-dependent haloperoxidase [Bacteroidota bacterium]
MAQQNNYLFRCNEKLIDVVMEDLFTPPVASRVYVYPNIAAYEVLALNNPSLVSLSGQIKHLPALKPELAPINYSIAAEFAFTTVAKKLVFSEYKITELEENEKKIWSSLVADDSIIQSSIAFGRKAGNIIIEWMMKDNYVTVKTMQRYELKEGADKWKPTAPEYTNALEPNWSKMRPLVMDSSSQIKPIPPVPYSELKTSQFYKEALAVYKTHNTLDTTQKTIAAFWDCNPNISMSDGHITVFVHKISPGGHWIKIAGQACNNLAFDEIKTAEVYTLLTTSIYDAFISCWTSKFILNTIRPETYIQRLIDLEFTPTIQTPPFPEYPSGHSVVSAAAATVLSELIPQPYAFTDSSELYINLPPRSFLSFTAASQEASVSRFYGGIHFMPALDNGLVQGQKIGKYIYQRLQTRKK